jgi:uncharacterized protein YqiB (DUF1249 family)
VDAVPLQLHKYSEGLFYTRYTMEIAGLHRVKKKDHASIEGLLPDCPADKGSRDAGVEEKECSQKIHGCLEDERPASQY